jgi:GTP-binding protein
MTEASEAASSQPETLGRLPVVAIVGRPNVGKSTLFNRLARTQRAIVDSRPGVTRDRNMATARWEDRALLLVDTGGIEDTDAGELAASVRAQSALAAEEADVVIAVLDGRAGVTPPDRDLMQRLRRLRKPVVYAVNKLDTPARDAEAADFFALGLAQVFAISAAHGRGVAALMARVLEQLPPSPTAAPAGMGSVTLAIIGRPNVGKSSLLNRIVGYERVIVDAKPGTTRDAIDTPFRHGMQDYVLVDTAGIRRRPRVQEPIERTSVVRALRALERAEVAILVVDAAEGVTDQDARIAGYAWERGRGLLFAVNKWDAVPHTERDAERFLRALGARYPTLADVPAVFISARTGADVADLFPALKRLVDAHRRQLRTVRLNQVLEEAVHAQAPASVHGKRPRFFYATQTGTAPPVITIFSSAPQLVQTAYERYLSHVVRTAFSLYGTPLRLRFRARPKSERSDRRRRSESTSS